MPHDQWNRYGSRSIETRRYKGHVRSDNDSLTFARLNVTLRNWKQFQENVVTVSNFGDITGHDNHQSPNLLAIGKGTRAHRRKEYVPRFQHWAWSFQCVALPTGMYTLSLCCREATGQWASNILIRPQLVSMKSQRIKSLVVCIPGDFLH